jgi:hypothetical protein
VLHVDHSMRRVGGSIPATDTGVAKNLLENAIPQGKILNGLDFPMWKDSQWDRRAYATDMVAWDYLLGSPHCGTITTPYPTGDMRWGLAGTAHTVSMFHVDSDGFATFGQVMCGKKLWAVYRPSSTLPLSDINFFLRSENFQLDKIPAKAKFGLEAVVLRPGDLLYVLFCFIHHFLIFKQANATWYPTLRLWPRKHHNSWWSFLLFIPNASNPTKHGTHLCPRRLHIKYLSLSISSAVATYHHFLGPRIARGSHYITG